MAGWGTTTLISSGKDVYIHYAAPEFAFALANDARTKAAVLYAEPGGYYELDANFTKPVVACVVGRWKSKLTRAVGHAGAMAGGNDDAQAKEQWFMAKFGVDDIFTPENPVFSPRGAVVTNIAHIPQALTAVMQANAARPDFEPEGSLALKPWFGSSQGIVLPPELDLPVVTAASPYDKQIEHLNRQIGAVFPRQAMKDASGASQMDAKTQITSLHGTSMLDAAQFPVESNICLSLLRGPGSEKIGSWSTPPLGRRSTCSARRPWPPLRRPGRRATPPTRFWPLRAASWTTTCRPARQAVRALVEGFTAAGLRRPSMRNSIWVRSVRRRRKPVRVRSARRKSRSPAERIADPWREVRLRALSSHPQWPSIGRCRSGRSSHDPGVGAVDA